LPELSETEYRRFLELLDKDAIRDVLARVSRGVDRLDAEILRGVYWPDATVNASMFDGPAEDFIAWLLGMGYDPTTGAAHTICNIKIDLDGDTAWGETYFAGYSENRPDGAEPFNNLTVGRYLDQFEKRRGEWRILKRTFAYELSGRLPHHTAWTQPPLLEKMRRGRRDGQDMIFRMREPGFPE